MQYSKIMNGKTENINCVNHHNSLIEIKQDIAEIKMALIGSELQPNGIISKVKINERSIIKIKESLNKNKNRNYVFYSVASVLLLLVTFWDKFIHIFKS